MRRVMIVGATSAIAMAVARQLASEGVFLVLAGRNSERLQRLAQDLQVRGCAGTELIHFDALEAIDFDALATRTWGEGLDMLLLAHGSLPDQQQVQDDPAATLRELQINTGSALAVLAAFAPRFEAQGRGSIGVISSVAGDRGRQSNYLYGASKAALSVYTDGLRNRLSSAGVAVVTLKPGFVDTAMTANFKKGPLWVQPETAARLILRAMERGGHTAYIPGFWRYIMLIITAIPDRLFKRLSL